MDDTAERQRGRLVVIGPVPPPVTGRTVVTGRLVEELTRAGVPHTLVNTAVVATGSPAWRKLRRALRLALFTARVVRGTRGTTTAYIPVDASPGTVFTLLYTLAARLAGARVVLHHHSYSYVAEPTLAMRCLCRVAGRDALHVTPCAAVTAELGAAYPAIGNSATLTNAFAIDPGLAEIAPKPPSDKLVLGHLSNLSVAKGTLTAIACFAELRSRGEPVELHLAGPIQDAAVGREIRAAAERYGQAFRHLGLVDAERKRAYFSSIDVFLFPTTFRNEVQPLAILESLAAGVPVIAFGRACIPSMVEGGCGLVVPPGGDFKTAAVHQVTAWRQDRAMLRMAGGAAQRRFLDFYSHSIVYLQMFLAYAGDRAPGLEQNTTQSAYRATEPQPGMPANVNTEAELWSGER